MNLQRFCLACLASLALVSVAGRAEAQIPSFQPPRPTLSPYFDLFRRESGPLGGYLSDYRPRQDFRRDLQQQAARQQQQTGAIRSLDRRMSLVEQPDESVRPTGTSSVFMNYSHYYNMRGSSGGGR